MFLGRVVGEVWATRKMADLDGKRLLVIEALDERREPGASKVTPVVAADPLGAALGQRVIVAFGKAARVACGGDGDYAFEAAIVGIVDDFDIPQAPDSWRENAGGEPRIAHAAPARVERDAKPRKRGA
ncbi:MAG: EutN/CcmL family microcompartment protein [Planctomycetes bacterium]|nr:EutN/CcmL family microcompartment protein [Planctomycetota bacterium]